MKMYLKSLENRDTKDSLHNKDVTVFTQAELIFFDFEESSRLNLLC